MLTGIQDGGGYIERFLSWMGKMDATKVMEI